MVGLEESIRDLPLEAWNGNVLWIWALTDGLPRRCCASAKASTAQLRPQVVQWSAGSYLEDQDMWWLPGIARPVFLLPKPATHITDYSATPDMRF